MSIRRSFSWDQDRAIVEGISHVQIPDTLKSYVDIWIFMHACSGHAQWQLLGLTDRMRTGIMFAIVKKTLHTEGWFPIHIRSDCQDLAKDKLEDQDEQACKGYIR